MKKIFNVTLHWLQRTVPSSLEDIIHTGQTPPVLSCLGWLHIDCMNMCGLIVYICFVPNVTPHSQDAKGTNISILKLRVELVFLQFVTFREKALWNCTNEDELTHFVWMKLKWSSRNFVEYLSVLRNSISSNLPSS